MKCNLPRRIRSRYHYAYGIPHHPFRRANYKDAWTPATTFLDERYHVREVDKHDLVRKFRRLELWEAMSARFSELFPKAHAQTPASSAKSGAGRYP